jgi:FkbM family methyltransferase
VTIPSVFNYLKRPEYIFRPRQVLYRFRRLGKEIPPVVTISLPWGLSVKVRTTEHIGSDIFHYGIFDRIVPEAIYRLADVGELAVEAGANIGQNCSLMLSKVGSTGRVIAFEPHPEIFQELKFNASLWSEKGKRNIQLENVALGETNGEAWLVDGSEFHHNRGSASLRGDAPETVQGRKYKVAVRTLDGFIPAPVKVGVCKIDVEGHELSVLKGAEQALSRRAIRDIIFEDFAPPPSPTMELLRKHQFTIFRLTASWWKPDLQEVTSETDRPPGFSYNYLATLDPQRAKDRFRPGAWSCLTCPPPSA